MSNSTSSTDSVKQLQAIRQQADDAFVHAVQWGIPASVVFCFMGAQS